jgi:hypothetical protein
MNNQFKINNFTEQNPTWQVNSRPEPPVQNSLPTWPSSKPPGYNICTNHIENTVLLLLRACWGVLPCNGRCLQSHRLTTGLYIRLWIKTIFGWLFNDAVIEETT